MERDSTTDQYAQVRSYSQSMVTQQIQIDRYLMKCSPQETTRTPMEPSTLRLAIRTTILSCQTAKLILTHLS